MTTGTERLDWTLQHYSIGHLIASGHFGVVYQARHVSTGQDVALKLIPLHGQDSDEKVAAERHGAVLQQRFGDAHGHMVPAVFEHQTMVPFYAIAMELVRGRQLTTLIAQGPIAPRHTAEIGLAIARFLEHAHRFETEIEGQRYALIVHADLKPDHVLLLDDGSIRVLDFGIAKALATRTLVTTNKWGSVQYASPERLQSDGHVNEHADFWSLGVMLFEMVAGFRPYRRYEHNPSLLDNAIRKQEAREPLPPDVDPVLAAVVHKLLAPQIDRRYGSAAEIARDLHAYLNGEPTAAGLEHARASQETIRLSPAAAVVAASDTPTSVLEAGRGPASRPSEVPTEPLTRHADAAIEAGTSAPAAAPDVPASRPPQTMTNRLVRVLVLVGGLATTASEGSALIRAEQLRARVPALDVSELAHVREEYYRIDHWTPLGLGTARLRRPLTRRMTELADRTIFEYRTDTPAVAQAQWESARQSLDFAMVISPSDRAVAGKRLYVLGHLARIDGSVDQAIRLFRSSVRLMPNSPDPYLGLATVFAYGTHDLDGFLQAIDDARRHGFVPGRRVRAWSGDLYLWLADRARNDARKLQGDERLEQLEQAAADYQKCIESFDGLRFFNSEPNLRLCRRRLTEVSAQLPAIQLDPPPSDGVPRAL
jgi:serine/threonine protein kinase